VRGRLLAPGFALGVALGLAVGRPAAAAPLDDHAVELVEAAELAVGDRAALSLTIAPRPGFRVAATPLAIELRVEPAGGLAIERRRLARTDAADPRASAPRFDLAVRGEREGSYALAVEARFWICRAHTCRPVRWRRTVAVAVRPAAPPPDEPPAP
jgi:hypothetical protein